MHYCAKCHTEGTDGCARFAADVANTWADYPKFGPTCSAGYLAGWLLLAEHHTYLLANALVASHATDAAAYANGN